MLINLYLQVRRRLVFDCVPDFSPQRYLALDSDPAQARQVLEPWERVFAAPLHAFSADLHEALVDMHNKRHVAEVHRSLKEAIARRRKQIPDYEWMLNSATSLLTPFEKVPERASTVAYRDMLRAMWIATSRHEYLALAYETKQRPTEQSGRAFNMSPAEQLWEMREWMAAHIHDLLLLTDYVDAVDQAMAEEGMYAARNVAAQKLYTLAHSTLRLVHQVPGLRTAIEVPDDDQEFEQRMHTFIGVLPY